MALDKVLKIYDEQGNSVDYDILASDVKFLPNGKDLPTKLTEMEDAIEDAAESGGYTPPQGGIPKTDLAPSVQTSLGLADTALQEADKIQLQAAINAVQTALDNLMNGQNVTDAIDTFNEVKAFLDGIDTDDPTLANQLLALNNAISALQTALAGKISGIRANGASETLPVVNGIVELPPAGSTISPADTAPQMDGTANVGSSAKYAREDHVHPHDSTKANASDVYTKTQADTLLAGKQNMLTFDNAPTAGSNNAVKSGGVKQAIDDKLTEVTVSAISAGQAVLSASEANGVLYIFLQQRDLTVTPNPLLFGASGGTLIISGVALVNAITVAVQSGDFTVDGAASKTIAAADANGTNNIAVAYTGSAGAGSGSIRVTCGETTVDVIVKYDADGIEGYTRVGYIQNTNDSYIDTGYIPNVNSRFSVEATIDDTLSAARFLFGQRPSYCTNASELMLTDTQQVKWVFGTYTGSYSNDSNFNLSVVVNAGTKCSFVTDDSKITVTPDGGNAVTKTASGKQSGTPSGNTVLSVFIFTNHYNSGASGSRTLAKIHSFKIYEGPTLVRDYVPAQRDIDGVYGLYDLINNTFITTAEGTTALSGGN